ncbi:hypothetical protein A2477_02080 [Candidatus Falkowbacteria bacterium RIFOXYC2_FULL_47_12]|uniref:Uncharacterized protein n=2 Tax=Candidatus Falkowiibacteriota TaxID=1752728 RepID=A0A1F5TRD5_9BACT|nr:MAG: hypothetical protein A2242_02980 [Candidatus Falkowbacteria bacterium RIFOXYA2_FULL_47_9]OGF41388.1 MAG: hypothetical protein A2477_02080 [Candidatus Falkowbacteria bacterium RIFOXYC2_FULL_47_12]
MSDVTTNLQNNLTAITAANARAKEALAEIDARIMESDLRYAQMIVDGDIAVLKQTKAILARRNS